MLTSSSARSIPDGRCFPLTLPFNTLQKRNVRARKLVEAIPQLGQFQCKGERRDGASLVECTFSLPHMHFPPYASRVRLSEEGPSTSEITLRLSRLLAYRDESVLASSERLTV